MQSSKPARTNKGAPRGFLLAFQKLRKEPRSFNVASTIKYVSMIENAFAELARSSRVLTSKPPAKDAKVTPVERTIKTCSAQRRKARRQALNDSPYMREYRKVEPNVSLQKATRQLLSGAEPHMTTRQSRKAALESVKIALEPSRVSRIPRRPRKRDPAKVKAYIAKCNAKRKLAKVRKEKGKQKEASPPPRPSQPNKPSKPESENRGIPDQYGAYFTDSPDWKRYKKQQWEQKQMEAYRKAHAQDEWRPSILNRPDRSVIRKAIKNLYYYGF